MQVNIGENVNADPHRYMSQCRSVVVQNPCKRMQRAVRTVEALRLHTNSPITHQRAQSLKVEI